MNCIECKHDISELVNFDTLCDDFIECPNCSTKMTVEYDESYDEESGNESGWFWLEKYYTD